MPANATSVFDSMKRFMFESIKIGEDSIKLIR